MAKLQQHYSFNMMHSQVQGLIANWSHNSNALKRPILLCHLEYTLTKHNRHK